MLKRFKYLLLNRMKNNTLIYAILVIFILIGMIIGALWVGITSIESKEMLKLGLGNYLLSMPSYNFNNIFIFKTSLLSNIIPILILFIVSIKYMGIFLAPLYLAFRGFCLGFTIAFLTEVFGRKGFFLTLIAMLPQNIIYIPTLIFSCFISVNLSLIMFRHRKERFNDNKIGYIMKYIAYNLATIAALILASFIEAYITPVFIRSITPYL